MLKNKIQEEIIIAMKAHDAVKLSTLRLLSNALHNEEIAKQHELTEDEEIAVVKRQLKQREESIEALRQAQGKLTLMSDADIVQRIKNETAEAEILKVYLPEQMGNAQIEQIVDKVITEMPDQKDFGKIMQAVVLQTKGKADGKIVSEIVKGKLGKIS